MGKWGCRGIPPGRQPFHHLLRMTADLKVYIRTLTLTHTHTLEFQPVLGLQRKAQTVIHWMQVFLCPFDYY